VAIWRIAQQYMVFHTIYLWIRVIINTFFQRYAYTSNSAAHPTHTLCLLFMGMIEIRWISEPPDIVLDTQLLGLCSQMVCLCLHKSPAWYDIRTSEWSISIWTYPLFYATAFTRTLQLACSDKSIAVADFSVGNLVGAILIHVPSSRLPAQAGFSHQTVL
jgi:hypothetical protein